jgi:hypothetical protein
VDAAGHPPNFKFSFVPMPQLKAFTMKCTSYKENYTMSNDICIYYLSTIIGLLSTSIGLDINPKTSGQQPYVQLPFNMQGFEKSLTGAAMNNHYRCKPIS